VHKLITALAVSIVIVAAGGAFWYYGPYHHDRGVLTLPGTVEIQEVRIGSKLGGRVKSVAVREGDHVTAGQELVRFETPELDAQHEQLQAKLASAEADLLKARNGPRPEEKADAQAMVESAEARLLRLQNGWREEEKRQSKNDYEAGEADLVQGKAEFARVERLFRESPGSITRSEFDLARAARDRSHSRAEAAKAKYDMMMNGSRPEDVAEAAAEVARARAKHALLLAGTRSEEVAMAEAQVREIKGRIDENEANRREAVVRAPGAAVVEILSVRPGDLLPPNQPVARILRDEDLWVKVFVPETELGQVRLNQAVEVTVDAYPGRRFPGTVMQIANQSEFTPRNVQSPDERRHQVFAVKVRVENREGVFKSGMAADVALPLAGEP